jgi:hypothetical protein
VRTRSTSAKRQQATSLRCVVKSSRSSPTQRDRLRLFTLERRAGACYDGAKTGAAWFTLFLGTQQVREQSY